MPGDPGGPVVNTRVLSTNAHEAAGAAGTRHSPRPLFSWAKDSSATRAHRAARRERVFVVGARTRGYVPRMLRSAISAFTRVFDALCLAAWCAADPGSIVHSASPWAAALRSSVKKAAPRPGHEA